MSAGTRAIIVVSGLTLAAGSAAVVGGQLSRPVPAVSASYPLCEKVATSGSLVGDHGPYGTCVGSPLSTNCVVTYPTIGSLLGVYVEACVVD